MKRILSCILLLVMSFALVSCSSGDNTQELNRKLQSELVIDVTTGELAFTFTKNGDDVSIVMNSPKTLKGLTLVKTAEGISASYKGILVPLPSSSAEKVFMLNDIIDCIVTAVSKGDYTYTKESDYNVISTTNGSIVCELLYDNLFNLISADITSDGKTTTFIFSIKEEQSKNE